MPLLTNNYNFGGLRLHTTECSNLELIPFYTLQDTFANTQHFITVNPHRCLPILFQITTEILHQICTIFTDYAQPVILKIFGSVLTPTVTPSDNVSSRIHVLTRPLMTSIVMCLSRYALSGLKWYTYYYSYSGFRNSWMNILNLTRTTRIQHTIHVRVVIVIKSTQISTHARDLLFFNKLYNMNMNINDGFNWVWFCTLIM